MEVVPVLLAAALLVLVVLAFWRRPAADLSTPLQNRTQAVQQEQTQTAVLAEKLARLEPPAQVAGYR